MMQYLCGTPNMPMVLSRDRSGVICWWADGSHSTHANLHGHMGRCMSLGQGMIVTSSLKQKLNTRSSTETKLVAINNTLPLLLWANNFLQSQKYDLKETILYQDNQSAILLERNGHLSSSHQTRHLNAQYFFITNCITKGDLDVRYCPTEEMVADFFTKPLQGNMFIKL